MPLWRLRRFRFMSGVNPKLETRNSKLLPHREYAAAVTQAVNTFDDDNLTRLKAR